MNVLHNSAVLCKTLLNNSVHAGVYCLGQNCCINLKPLLMKKKLLCLLAFVAGGYALQAQYYEGTYGTTANEALESGVNASPNWTPFFPGQIMAGYTDIMGGSAVSVIRTDITGSSTSGPPYFNNFIQYAVNNAPVDTRGRRVLHYTFAGDEILVWGDYTTSPGAVSDRFFLLRLTGDGNTMIYTQDYQFAGPVNEVEATSMCASRMFPGRIYVCGWMRQTAGGTRQPIAMCVDGTNGMPYWAMQYSTSLAAPEGDWVANDLEESVTDIGGFSVALVGHVWSKIGASKYTPILPHPSFYTVDALTGMPTSGLQVYGGQGAFEAINVAYGYTGSIPGFVMAGGLYSNAWQTNYMFAMRCDPYGMGVDFSQMINSFIYGPGPTWAYDVVERYSVANAAYEYYLGGDHYMNNDAAIVKLDASGIPVTNGQWTYGSTGTERILQLDYYEMPSDSSLSIFGKTNSGSLSAGGEDFYHLKSYFNGYLSGSCNVAMANAADTWAYGYITQYNILPASSLAPQIQLQPWAMGNQSDLINCSGTNGSGSNARQLQSRANSNAQQPFLFPNPISRDNAALTLQLAPSAGTVQLDLRNALGQLVMEKEELLSEGQSKLQLDLGKLEAGVYLLSVNHNGALTTHRIVVQ
jgi:hypothetical protein